MGLCYQLSVISLETDNRHANASLFLWICSLVSLRALDRHARRGRRLKIWRASEKRTAREPSRAKAMQGSMEET